MNSGIFKDRECFLTTGRALHRKPFLQEKIPEQSQIIRVIVDYQNALHFGSTTCLIFYGSLSVQDIIPVQADNLFTQQTQTIADNKEARPHVGEYRHPHGSVPHNSEPEKNRLDPQCQSYVLLENRRSGAG